ncbi:pilus assembly protein PilP, partial [Citrobacter braakii]
MGMMIVALGLVFMLITGHVVESQRMQTQARTQTATVRVPAQQMLGLAAAINDWRHDHPLRDGDVPLSALALVSPPDGRIHHRIVSDRLWVWRADTPGLVSSLRTLSDG